MNKYSDFIESQGLTDSLVEATNNILAEGYKGKYPNRINTIWANPGEKHPEHGSVGHLKTNSGEIHHFFARETNHDIPKLNDELSKWKTHVGKYLIKEDVEQIDELSKETLKRYIKSAEYRADAHKFSTKDDKNSPIAKTHLELEKLRRNGIVIAKNKVYEK